MLRPGCFCRCSRKARSLYLGCAYADLTRNEGIARSIRTVGRRENGRHDCKPPCRGFESLLPQHNRGFNEHADGAGPPAPQRLTVRAALAGHAGLTKTERFGKPGRFSSRKTHLRARAGVSWGRSLWSTKSVWRPPARPCACLTDQADEPGVPEPGKTGACPLHAADSPPPPPSTTADAGLDLPRVPDHPDL